MTTERPDDLKFETDLNYGTEDFLEPYVIQDKKTKKRMQKAQKIQKQKPAKVQKQQVVSSKPMKSSTKTHQKSSSSGVPKTAAESIPYLGVYKNGIIEVEKGRFSKSYIFPEMNFKVSNEDIQARISDDYSAFISSFSEGTDVEITVYNKTIALEEFKKKVFIPMRMDNLNDLREEYNKMLEDKMIGVKNNLDTVKVLTITINATDIFMANEKFLGIDQNVNDTLGTLTGSSVEPMSLIDRLSMLYSIYHCGEEKPFYEKRIINGHEVETFNLEHCYSQGITTKDVICPSGFKFFDNYAVVGEKLVKSYYIQMWPTWLKGSFLTDFTEIPTNILISAHLMPIEQTKAIRMIKNKGVDITSAIQEKQKKLTRSGIDPNLISEDLKDSRREQKALIEGITKDNAKLFTATIVFTIFADNEEDMKGFESQLKIIASRHFATLNPLFMQQEDALATALPIGNCSVKIDRLITSYTVGSIIPFDVLNIRQEGGTYYGINAISKVMNIINRSLASNYNSVIMGEPGSGKTFATKREIADVVLATDDDVFVIDPEREYKILCEEMHGNVVKIANGSSTYINPFDLNLDNYDDERGDPVKVKCDFIETVCDIMIGGKYGLSPAHKSIIDRSVMTIYEDYIRYLNNTGLKQDFEKAPTLVDFYNDLTRQTEPEAQDLALGLLRYVTGAYDVFSHHTNIDTNNRFTVYDIKDIGPGLKELGLHICLDNVWNKMVSNAANHKKTWFYIDEFYILMQKQSSASYVSEIWKRARKWNGYPCAITQNVEDMIKSEETRTVLNNSSLVTLLGQSPINKAQLSQIYNLSSEEQKYIGSSKPGMGLIISNKNNIIPTNDDFPKDTKLYRIMTTKPDERIY